MPMIEGVFRQVTLDEWCHGITHDGIPLDPVKSAQYRACREPIAPPTPLVSLDQPNVIRPAPRPLSTTGDILVTLFSDWSRWIVLTDAEDHSTVEDIAVAGRSSCLGCQGLATQMNQWGPDECERRADEIIQRIIANAGHFRITLTNLPVSSIPFFSSIIRRFVTTAIGLSRVPPPGN